MIKESLGFSCETTMIVAKHISLIKIQFHKGFFQYFSQLLTKFAHRYLEICYAQNIRIKVPAILVCTSVFD